MPLKKSPSKRKKVMQKTVSANIRKLHAEHAGEEAWPHKRMVAAAHRAAGAPKPRSTPNTPNRRK